MKKITLTIKDEKKTSFLLELLRQFKFIEIDTGEIVDDKRYDFFESAGLWKNRKINAEQLRRRAWKMDQ